LGIGSITLRGQKRGNPFGCPARHRFAGSTPATATGVACIKIN